MTYLFCSVLETNFPLELSEINNSFVSLNTRRKSRSILELALIIVTVHTWRTDP